MIPGWICTLTSGTYCAKLVASVAGLRLYRDDYRAILRRCTTTPSGSSKRNRLEMHCLLHHRLWTWHIFSFMHGNARQKVTAKHPGTALCIPAYWIWLCVGPNILLSLLIGTHMLQVDSGMMFDMPIAAPLLESNLPILFPQSLSDKALNPRW